jgi:ATP-dependent Clp protease ATP-binding subunit ClpC
MLNNMNPNAGNGNPNSGGTGGSGNGGGNGGSGIPASAFTGGFGMDDEEFDPNEYLINYNEKFKNEPPILFRDAVIQQTLSCLIGKFKPNALLIGACGVGKTKIVEDIARRIAVGDILIPSRLQDYTIWELPITNIVSGSGLVGEVERKTKNIIKFASDPANKVILFIDEIHVLIGQSKTYEQIAQIMKPALARGDMKVIGATTSQEAQNLMDDPAFNRRFTRLIVDEFSVEQTEVILNNMTTSMFDHYDKKIAINDKLIKEVVKVADEYRTMGSHRPDNAITLLDRAMSTAYIKRKVMEVQAQNDPQLAAALQNMPTMSLSKSQLRATAMKLMTGNNEKVIVDTNEMRNQLSVIKGQDQAIDYLIDTVERDNLSLFQRQKPLTILFAGNSGVGKTEVVKIIAQYITGVKPIILNMTEYTDHTTINRIIGSSAGFVGYDSKMELPFDILESNPYQIILLDEFEKAHRSVQRLFMSAFDEGYIKTSRGKVIDFSKSIIIATTNAGHTTKSDPIGFIEDDAQTGASVADLSKFFDVELLNRFTKVINFNPITRNLFKEIAADTYKRTVAKVKSKHPSFTFLADEMSDDEVEEFAEKNFVKEYGARPVRPAIQKIIEDAVLEFKHNNANGFASVVNPSDTDDILLPSGEEDAAQSEDTDTDNAQSEDA